MQGFPDGGSISDRKPLFILLVNPHKGLTESMERRYLCFSFWMAKEQACRKKPILETGLDQSISWRSGRLAL